MVSFSFDVSIADPETLPLVSHLLLNLKIFHFHSKICAELYFILSMLMARRMLVSIKSYDAVACDR